MRPSARPLLASCTLAAGLLTGAAGATEPRQLIDAAVAAHGGPAGLATWDDMSVEGDAVIFFGPRETPSELALAVRGGSMLRRAARLEFRGTMTQFVSANTQQSAWQQRGSRTYDIPAHDFEVWLAHLPSALLRSAASDGADLAIAGEQDLDGTPVVVVTVSRDGHTARLGLERETHLVRSVEYETTVNRGMGTAEKVFVKRTFGAYREVGGVPFPHAWSEHEDGAESSRLTVTSVELGTPPALALFAKPEPDPLANEWRDQIAN